MSFDYTTFFLMCIHKPLKCRKTCYKMIFWPEHAEDISRVYLVNQIFESISDLFTKEISKKDIIPPCITVCVCVSPCSIDKKCTLLYFYWKKFKIKKCIMHISFWIYYWKHTKYFLASPPLCMWSHNQDPMTKLYLWYQTELWDWQIRSFEFHQNNCLCQHLCKNLSNITNPQVKMKMVIKNKQLQHYFFSYVLVNSQRSLYVMWADPGGGALTLERGMGMCRGHDPLFSDQSPLPSLPIYRQCAALVPLVFNFKKFFAFSAMFWPKF